MSKECKDQLNRPLRDLRISVIDRCNLRCPYCMPKEQYGKSYQFLSKNDLLSFEEITRLARIMVGMGVEKIRVTGGEPLLRPDLPDLIKAFAQLNHLKDLALTTNGLWLTEQVQDLKEAGLKRLTVSLDSLNKDVYRTLSGDRGNIRRVLDGIREAEEVGFSSIKINTVVIKGINDHLVMDLVRHFKGSKHIVRFIEYMDVGNVNQWQSSQVMPSKDILEHIQQEFPLQAVEANYYGEVASRYHFSDGSGEIGFISSVTQPFCQDCTRLRLSADGRLYTCLFAKSFLDLRPLLKDNVTDQEIEHAIAHYWEKRSDRYSEIRYDAKHPVEKAEMFHLGG